MGICKRGENNCVKSGHMEQKCGKLSTAQAPDLSKCEERNIEIISLRPPIQYYLDATVRYNRKSALLVILNISRIK